MGARLASSMAALLAAVEAEPCSTTDELTAALGWSLEITRRRLDGLALRGLVHKRQSTRPEPGRSVRRPFVW